MIVDGLVPERVVTLVAAATIFVVMFTLGLGIVLSEFRGVVRDSGLVGRALFAALVAVPVLAVVVVRAFDLPRPVQVGTVLMPGSRIGTLQLTAWRAISRSISAMYLYQRPC